MRLRRRRAGWAILVRIPAQGVSDMARVWDQFLSERDKAHLAATWTKTQPFGFGARPVLLVIDDYLGSLGVEPLPLLEAVTMWTNSCGLEGWDAVAKTQ